MAGLLLLESFDWTATVTDLISPGKWDYQSSQLSGTSPRTGILCLQLGNDWYLRKIVSNLSTLTVGFGLRVSTNPPYGSTFGLFHFRDNATDQVTIGLDTTGKLFAARGAYNGTVLGTGTTAINMSGWYYVECKVVIASSGGSVEVRLNGNSTPEITFSGDTANTANDYCTLVGPYGANVGGGGNPGSAFFDDIYIWDGSNFCGDTKVQALKPNGAGNYSQFTPSAGSNYQNVDDGYNHDSDTTYNSSSTNGHIDTYAMENTSIAGTVIGVSQTAFLRKDDAGSRNAALVLRSNVTDSVGSDIVLSDGYAPYSRLFALDPNGDIAWTTSAVDALEAGVKVTS